MKPDYFSPPDDGGQDEADDLDPTVGQTERRQRWKYEAPLLWMRDHPGHTEDDFDAYRGPNATPEQAAEWKRWFNGVWIHQPSSHYRRKRKQG